MRNFLWLFVANLLTVEKNMDKLEEIFMMQGKLDGFIAKERGLNFSNEEWIQKKSMAMIAEVSELLAEVNYKWWKNPRELNDNAIKEEMVDILHFLVGMCINAGMTAEEMHKIYLDKNLENFNRQNGLSNKEGYNLNNLQKNDD